MPELLKIYKTPERWIAIYEDNRASTWTPVTVLEDNEVLETAQEDKFHGDIHQIVFSNDILACVNGEKEQYLFWRAETEETKQPQPIDITKDHSLDRFDLIINR